LRFNPRKLLIDPYAKAIEGEVDWGLAQVLPYTPDGSDDAEYEPDDEDSAPAIPKCLVVDQSLRLGGRPAAAHAVDRHRHLRDARQGLHDAASGLREDLRGTYGGLASEPAIDYLCELGVTAVELLPVHHIIDESFLNEKGLKNYWGYSSIGYLAPHALYAATGETGEQVREFKGMVEALHRKGIEVILDVVYNHTAEGNHLGPMLSFKGVDNPSYHRLSPEDLRFYVDFTGTGNTLNTVHPPSTLRLIMDSLRYWVVECHVDGFRFDLASTLARGLFEVDRLGAFFDHIHQDPVLSQVKLIAEPWDVGPGGYQVGNFPVLWSEWNGIYRDEMRDFWRGESPERVRRPPDGIGRPLPRPLPVGLDQLHHRPRRLYAARPRLLQREAQRGQSRGQPGRHRRQPLLELRRRGGDRRSGDPRAARAPDAQLHRDPAALPGARGVRTRRSPGTAGNSSPTRSGCSRSPSA